MTEQCYPKERIAERENLFSQQISSILKHIKNILAHIPNEVNMSFYLTDRETPSSAEVKKTGVVLRAGDVNMFLSEGNPTLSCNDTPPEKNIVVLKSFAKALLAHCSVPDEIRERVGNFLNTLPEGIET
ncbi:hypothetical protein IPN35_01545 [Candidatus Peregrinibacteria bacterium]|nr:MAG: hypothetical protein IPN35_01545 [Candidatus Peregrinibacteria bacterium]